MHDKMNPVYSFVYSNKKAAMILFSYLPYYQSGDKGNRTIDVKRFKKNKI